eukprot:GHVU01101848.1.p1 GENE.GHVU01101848.1~~GHVU01101848.1.p1  ORF type:complete len:496 (+),score=52.28 GHVU01101848.1:1612-3099(+)
MMLAKVTWLLIAAFGGLLCIRASHSKFLFKDNKRVQELRETEDVPPSKIGTLRPNGNNSNDAFPDLLHEAAVAALQHGRQRWSSEAVDARPRARLRDALLALLHMTVKWVPLSAARRPELRERVSAAAELWRVAGQTFPGSNVREELRVGHELLLKLHSNEDLTAEGYVAALVFSDAPATHPLQVAGLRPVLAGSPPFETCDTFTCAVWTFFHIASVGIYFQPNDAAAAAAQRQASARTPTVSPKGLTDPSGDGARVSTSQYVTNSDLLTVLASFVKVLFPCAECQGNFAKMYDCKYNRCDWFPDDEGPRVALPEGVPEPLLAAFYLWRIHNVVTVRVANERVAAAKADYQVDVRFPPMSPVDACPKCRAQGSRPLQLCGDQCPSSASSTKSSHLDRMSDYRVQEVLVYLLQTYVASDQAQVQQPLKAMTDHVAATAKGRTSKQEAKKHFKSPASLYRLSPSLRAAVDLGWEFYSSSIDLSAAASMEKHSPQQQQ